MHWMNDSQFTVNDIVELRLTLRRVSRFQVEFVFEPLVQILHYVFVRRYLMFSQGLYLVMVWHKSLWGNILRSTACEKWDISHRIVCPHIEPYYYLLQHLPRHSMRSTHMKWMAKKLGQYSPHLLLTQLKHCEHVLWPVAIILKGNIPSQEIKFRKKHVTFARDKPEVRQFLILSELMLLFA